MAGALAAAIGGLFDLGSAGLAGGLSFASAKDAMDFQKKMFKNRYQWTADDMEKAGLNRILALSQGGGGVPPGATASFPNPQLGSSVREGFRTAADVRLREQELKNAKLMEANIHYDTAKKLEEAMATRSQGKKAEADIAVSSASAKQIEQQTRMLGYEEAMKKADSAFYSSDAGRTLRTVERVMGSLRGLRR